jgi:hypothetical protein
MNWGRGGPDRGQTEQEILRRMYELPEIPSPYVRLDGSKRSQRKGKSKYEL